MLIDCCHSLTTLLSIPHNYPKLSQQDRFDTNEVFIFLLETLSLFQSLVDETYEVHIPLKKLKTMTKQQKKGEFILKYYRECLDKDS